MCSVCSLRFWNLARVRAVVVAFETSLPLRTCRSKPNFIVQREGEAETLQAWMIDPYTLSLRRTT